MTVVKRFFQLAAIVSIVLLPTFGSAEVVKVSIANRASVANGQSFGTVGAYEKLTGTIEFALDPADAHNKAIADLPHASRAADGRVHFTSDLYVLKPVDASRGNGALFFEISNRGNKSLLTRFNSARNAADPSAPEDFGNGFLMREGYTLVWVGWEFDVAAPGIRIEPPPAAGITGPLTVRAIPNASATEMTFTDAAKYPPARLDDPAATLSVRSRFWDRPLPIERARWSFIGSGPAPRISLQGGFEAGRTYELVYSPAGAVVAGVGMAAIRDAAAAFRYRTDLPVRGQAAYIYGASQSGRFLRQFLYEGFNADERDRRVFDAVWPHIAGAARGSFNERFAMPTSLGSFIATQFPFANAPQQMDGHTRGLLDVYQPSQLPKIVYTNTDVEYWGGGRAAALTHTTVDGKKDAPLPDNIRVYFLAGTQHGEAAFPPQLSENGQQLPNPVPQREVHRALLMGLHRWVHDGVAPPASRYPRLDAGTLTPMSAVKFPKLGGVRDPRTIPGPALGATRPLPFLVPQVDADGNDIGGIRVPDQMVPLATTTGWNFRGEKVGNPDDIFALLGSYIPFAVTKVQRTANGDPRLSIEERYAGREDYLQRIRNAANALIKERYLLDEDLDNVLARANAHWEFATKK